ncbi:uncharacterized protein BKA55DRAFT_688388 [Fusarium redolens]|uniref:Uncharacterized protein n=1 Tax=Fusarium redolens TaxID=48865 RepID=A0A9P9HD02_FUSRE|nr:uncharacterized protein BKA55DRAFT_688388 [Fusarium redolens]KAH7255370.1 hypothetical protein BKA55DRAFT_688388 [Fusarium redolens]
MGLFNDIDIERDFPDHKVKSMVTSSEWAVQQHQDNFPGNSAQNYHQYPTQDVNTFDSYNSTYYGNNEQTSANTSYSTPRPQIGLAGLQAGLSLDSSGSEDDRSESRSEDEYGTGKLNLFHRHLSKD